MRDAMAKRTTKGKDNSQETYFRLSALSGERTRLANQLDGLRAKERLTLKRLGQVDQQIAGLRRTLDQESGQKRGGSSGSPGCGHPSWTEVELRY